MSEEVSFPRRESTDEAVSCAKASYRSRVLAGGSTPEFWALSGLRRRLEWLVESVEVDS